MFLIYVLKIAKATLMQIVVNGIVYFQTYC